jgi:acetolactate synthase-1/2/3 large subunit
MGFALPTAIGMAINSGGKAIVITGDGSLQINIQELDTVKRLGLDIAIIVMNNDSLGMVRNFQDMYFDGRNQSTKVGYSAPDFVALARAYGIDSYRVASHKDMVKIIGMIAGKQKPMLIDLVMPYATECRPRLAYGNKLDEQIPSFSLAD